MKQKELKNLAKKIAANEMIIQSSEDEKEVEKAQDEIFRLSSRVTSIEEMILLDDLIQEILQKNLQIYRDFANIKLS